MNAVKIEDAQANLPELIDQLAPGERVLITRDQMPIAELVTLASGQPQFGNCKGMLTIVSEDDEHLEDFQDYMP